MIFPFYDSQLITLQEWEMLSLIKSLKGMVRSSNAVVVITFPPSLLSLSSTKRWQHMADTLLSVAAIPGLISSFIGITASKTLYF